MNKRKRFPAEKVRLTVCDVTKRCKEKEDEKMSVKPPCDVPTSFMSLFYEKTSFYDHRKQTATASECEGKFFSLNGESARSVSQSMSKMD